MKTRRYILALIVIGFSMQYAAAQNRFGLTYNTALPLGETAELAGKYSFRGAGIEGRWGVGSSFDIGFSASWNVFYESVNGSFTEGSKTLTGTQYRYINAYPIMVTAYKSFGSSETFHPYVGLGVGAIKADHRKEMGLWYVDSNNWHFGMAPEIGVVIKTFRSFDYLVSIRYNYGVKVNDSPSVSYLGLNLGILL
jgi:opacity protein-like surface antigen